MLDYENIINELIKIRKSSSPIIAACVYGSQVQGTATEDSDLNVYLITAANVDFRGKYYIDGISVVYFEKSFMTIMREMEYYHKINNPFFASFFRNYKVIFDKANIIKELRQYQLELEKIEIRDYGLTERDYSELAFWYSKFNRNTERDESFFNFYYYVLLEQLRQKYHKANHYAPIYAKDVVTLYQDSEKADRYCLTLPNQEYRDFFSNCILQKTCDRDEKRKQIEEAIHFLGEDIEKEEPIECNPLKKQVFKNYLISFSRESKLLVDSAHNASFLYLYHNLVNNLENLNVLYRENSIPCFQDDYFKKLIAKPNLIYIDLVLNRYCKQSEINPNEYEISYFQKKYGNR